MFQNYFKTAWRSLLKNKTSSFINITGLAVGMATSIIIMLVVVNEFSYDKFNTNLKSIYLLMKNQKQKDGVSTGESTAGPMAASLRNEMPETKYSSRLAHFDDEQLKAGNKTILASGIYTEPDLFNIMTFPVIYGNAENALKDESSAVITESMAEKLFGDKNAIGKLIITANKNNFKVGAVVKDIPSNSTIQFDMALPFSFYAKQNDWLNKWDDNRIQTWVQLKPNSNLASLNNKLTKLLQTRSDDKSVSLFLYPLADLRLYGSFSNGKPDGGAIQMMILLIALGIFVILIACINFMNIATARSEHRSREVGVRKVVGASRNALIYQFLSEAFLTTFIALMLAAVIAQLVLPAFNQFTQKNIVFNFSDWRVWLLLVATGVFTALVAGSYPAFFLSNFKTVKVLKGAFANGKTGGGLRKVLVTVQFVISVFFITGVIVIYKQINYVQNRPLGYSQQNLIDISANDSLANKFDIFKNELSKITGVRNVSAGSNNILYFSSGITGMDYPGKTPGEEVSVFVSSVQYDWTKTMGISMLEGRDFNASFSTDTTAWIINEATVKKLGLKEPVIGAKIGGKTVIGVFKDFVYNNPSGIIAPVMISLQVNGLQHYFVRIDNSNQWQKTIAQIESAVKKITPNYPFDFSFISEDYQQRFNEWKSFGFMATIFGCMAIFIACLGLFGLSSFLAEKRGKEMSIRKVFGATAKNIWSLLSKDFLKPVCIALLITIPISVLLSHFLLAGITYHTSLTWWMFGLAGAITIFIALLTVSLQSIRAAIENPVKGLRME
ncbi:MAG TPA: ABC transporter permease [Chitinophagaceae bacterium]|nr:ABC transporter permease [Chitinophagaceae bacterium]